jgi:CelD/BcsL family acetyltransferase involved in cellulose biosynthesis
MASHSASPFPVDWDLCAHANPHATVFQTTHWYKAWIRAVAEPEAAEPLILRVPDKGRLRAGIALQIGRVDGQPAITPLSWPWADYHDAVGDPADKQSLAALACALDDCADSHRCPVILDEIVPGGLVAEALGRLGISPGSAAKTESIVLTDEPHIAEILASREHNVKWRRLNRLGPIRCLHHETAADILHRLPLFIEMHKKQWAARADAVAPFDGGVVDAAFESMVRHLAPQRMLLLTELLLDARPIAMYFGFVYGRRYLAYRTAFDASLRRLSPGHAMLRQMIQDFRARGFEEIDLMRGAYAYKGLYANRHSRNLRTQLHPGPRPSAVSLV